MLSVEENCDTISILFDLLNGVRERAFKWGCLGELLSWDAGHLKRLPKPCLGCRIESVHLTNLFTLGFNLLSGLVSILFSCNATFSYLPSFCPLPILSPLSLQVVCRYCHSSLQVFCFYRHSISPFVYPPFSLCIRHPNSYRRWLKRLQDHLSQWIIWKRVLCRTRSRYLCFLILKYC